MVINNWVFDELPTTSKAVLVVDHNGIRWIASCIFEANNKNKHHWQGVQVGRFGNMEIIPEVICWLPVPSVPVNEIKEYDILMLHELHQEEDICKYCLSREINPQPLTIKQRLINIFFRKDK